MWNLSNVLVVKLLHA